MPTIYCMSDHITRKDMSFQSVGKLVSLQNSTFVMLAFQQFAMLWKGEL